mmetsp:Transcript_29222/g.62143  ORF Transcript_29222/g.62143 Transcript_29222/m.62143 type:complete len:254 (-) Transcript_29222:292-1053(-)|eukprot:CAMPEP_0172313308 /NCGR_PEP_ID=MMETSP1058-20130122/20004_1 /TAXON_ID=83371 /ORGANISM="Detonula confervacea, Strain CCMP 353" /LENGTH=253 /DNA_ID=CAMNT_0013026947 /DNA_START=141 /DNA_END=902 /DNA_ORIENTATION=+
MNAIRESARRSLRLKKSNLKMCIQSLPLLLHGDETSSRHAIIIPCTPQNARCYFTNTDQMKKSDPFAQLGLEWGATATDIKDAYRRLARELHPDVSQLETTLALSKFRVVKEAYDKLINNKNAGTHRTDLWEEWAFSIWRSGDLIAQKRTDVAGAMRKRPVKPAESMKGRWGVASLGHPDGRGTTVGRGEYLASGDRKAQRSSTVGSGNSKWVQKKEFRPWNPEEVTLKGVSQYRKRGNFIGKTQTSGEKPES